MLGRWQIVVVALAFGALAAVPPLASAFDEPYYLTLFARIMIFAIAAVSLDLILGYGGMVSFGHAAYLGIGGYAVAILAYYGIENGYLQLLVAVAGSALVALVIGAISLRTRGVYFIMITLAFTQMLFFLGVSLEEYGGDDGINTYRSDLGLVDLYSPGHLYYLIWGFLALVVWLCHRIVNSRFGMVLRGSQENETRMQAVGFRTYRYRLTAFVIAGAFGGVSGFLLANLTEFVTPEYMNWFRSGEIMVMVLMGGMGSLFGPVIGAAAFILLEEYIPTFLGLFGRGFAQHWPVVFGPLLVLLVLFARGGLWGLVPGRRDPR